MYQTQAIIVGLVIVQRLFSWNVGCYVHISICVPVCTRRESEKEVKCLIYHSLPYSPLDSVSLWTWRLTGVLSALHGGLEFLGLHSHAWLHKYWEFELRPSSLCTLTLRATSQPLKCLLRVTPLDIFFFDNLSCLSLAGWYSLKSSDFITEYERSRVVRLSHPSPSIRGVSRVTGCGDLEGTIFVIGGG